MFDDAPLRAVLVCDSEVVRVGLSLVLEPFAHRITIVPWSVGVGCREFDVVLLGGRVLDRQLEARSQLPWWIAPDVAVVALTWEEEAPVIPGADDLGMGGLAGVRATVPLTLPAEDLVRRLEQICAGQIEHRAAADDRIGSDRPGAEVLSARETEMITLVVRGLSNRQIADKTYLSINSVKTYVRTAYRKMGVTSRSQAMLWGIRHGFAIDAVDPVRPRSSERDRGVPGGRPALLDAG